MVHSESNTPSKRETICLVSHTVRSITRSFQLTLPTSWRETPSGLICVVFRQNASSQSTNALAMTKDLSLTVPFSPAMVLAPSRRTGFLLASRMSPTRRRLGDCASPRLGVTARPTYPRTWHNRQRRLPRRYQLRSEEPSGQGEWTWPGLNGALSAGFETWLKEKGSYPSCEKRRGGLRGQRGLPSRLWEITYRRGQSWRTFWIRERCFRRGGEKRKRNEP